MENEDLIPHLFRTEFRKITAVLCKLFGIAHLEIAEDVAGETFLAALETWPYKGVPEQPVAWLYAVAKNKAKNQITRNVVFAGKVTAAIKSGPAIEPEVDIDLSEQNITDSQLKMLFAICHPAISMEAQIGLALRVLCGFGIDEIASALLTGRETINKRLHRAKEKLRQEKISIEFPGKKEINKRMDAVLTTLYLLFSEGYYSESNDVILREDLCHEAMRLTCLLLENVDTTQPKVYALLSLMCFHASRFASRKNEQGELILYQDQDEARWDQELITKGAYYLNLSAQGTEITKYHLEAAIAYWHTVKEDTQEKWENILQLFNQLLQLEYSPVAALNRTFALSKANGKAAAITEAEKLQLTDNHFYFMLLGELYAGTHDEKAQGYLRMALAMARTAGDRLFIQKKLEGLG